MKKFIAVFIFAAFTLPFAAQAESVPVTAGQMRLSFAPLVKSAGPAVVNIYAKRVVQERVRSPFFNDPFFSRFFNAPDFGGGVRERVAQSLGSGVILAADGLVATNHHVIDEATEIRVVTADNREYTAEKLLDDPRTDLAILKIDAKGEALPHLEMSDSDAVEVGDLVLAIGNPFGVGQTVTSGIVSAVARTDVGVSDYSFFIQTDAAINPGNSGGALVDIDGRLIGINSAIFSKDGGSLGIGFAIPANMVKVIAEAARHGGKVKRPWTGMVGQNISPDMRESLKLKTARGSLVAKVARAGPADKAGIRAGDVILAINGKEVQDPLALKFRIGTVALGSTVSLQVSRAGKIFEVALEAVAPPENPPREETKITALSPLQGAVVDNISPALSEEMGGLAADSGVVVFSAEEGAAAQLGLQKGDIIISVNGEKVASVAQLKKLLGKGGRQWKLSLRRDGRTINVTVSG